MSSDLVELGRPEPFDLLRNGPGDRYFDYCLQPYQPRHPTTGQLRSENIFWKSLHVVAAVDSFRQPMSALQESLGRDMTVWGAKFDGKSLWWELYFYDPQKEDERATLGGLTRTLAPWTDIRPFCRETVPYMMVSFDLFPDSFSKRRPVTEVNLYLTGTEAHEGRSYSVTETGRELENSYCFMAPKQEIDRVLPLLKSSVFVDYGDPRTLSEVLLPQLFACKRVCIAKKRHRDGIYFSGITVEQLLWFLRRFEYPEPIVEFTARHRAGFEHLYFDVGIDYEQAPDGTISHPKTSFYGTL